MNRKQRRATEKKAGKENSQKLAEKIFQFDKLPDECLACRKSFDKKNKEMAQTWNIIVRDKDTVRLYCPDCWGRANNLLSEWKDKIEKDKVQ